MGYCGAPFVNRCGRTRPQEIATPLRARNDTVVFADPQLTSISNDRTRSAEAVPSALQNIVPRNIGSGASCYLFFLSFRYQG